MLLHDFSVLFFFQNVEVNQNTAIVVATSKSFESETELVVTRVVIHQVQVRIMGISFFGLLLL